MANLALTTAARVEVVEMFESLTVIAGSAIVAGAPVAIVPATGKGVPADANGAAHLATVRGIATKSAAAGQAVTLMKRGIMEGFVLTDQDYDDAIYVSDDVGMLADAAGTTNLSVGRVIPAHANPPITSASDKLLYVDISYQIDIDTTA